MAKKRRRLSPQTIKRRRRLGLVLLLILVLLVLALVIRMVLGSSPETISPQPVTLRRVAPAQGYLLTKEKTYRARGEGVVIYHAQEGLKVPKDYLVANINLMNDNSKIKDDLVQVQAALDYKLNKGTSQSGRQGPSDEDLNIMRNIQLFVRDQDYEKLVASINSLDLNTKQAVNISDLNDLLKLSVDELQKMKESLSKDLSTTNADYKADFSGLVTFIIDDPQAQLSLEEDPETFTPSYLKDLDLKTIEGGGNRVSEDDPIFRLVDNLDWALALLVENPDQVKGLKEGDRVQLSLGQDQPAQARIIGANQDSQGRVLLVRLDDNFMTYYKDRVQDYKLIKSTTSCLKIPTSSLVKDKNGQEGVYKEEIHDIVKFVPLEVLHRKEEASFVQVKEEGTGLGPNDSIILDPDAIKEDQVVYKETE